MAARSQNGNIFGCCGNDFDMKIFAFISVACVLILGACGAQMAESGRVEEPEPALSESAGREPVLVELFTSEGCSSCPPADRQLILLETQQPVAKAEVITLAFHVDYWNRLGWKDEYSSAEYSERQNSYVQRMKLDSSYTPQMVVDGQAEFVGSNSERATQAISEAAARPKSRVDVRLEGATARIRIDDLKSQEPSIVYLAIAEDGIVTNVRAGENSGRKLPHISVVRKLEVIGELSSADKSFTETVPIPSDPSWKKDKLKYIVFVQETASGRVTAVGKAKSA